MFTIYILKEGMIHQTHGHVFHSLSQNYLLFLLKFFLSNKMRSIIKKKERENINKQQKNIRKYFLFIWIRLHTGNG